MADDNTVNYGWILPELGASADSWGEKWNGNLANIDANLKATDDAVEALDTATAKKTSNLSDLANAGTARTNLGLAIGTNVQAYHANLAALAGLSGAANKSPYFTDGGTMNMLTLTNNGKALMQAATAADVRSVAGVRINEQAVWVQSGTPGSPQDGDIWVW